MLYRHGFSHPFGYRVMIIYITNSLVHLFCLPRQYLTSKIVSILISLDQLSIRLCVAHILDIVLLAFILTLRSSSLPTLGSILSPSLQNLSSSIISDACVLFAPAVVHHFANFVNKCYMIRHVLPCLRPCYRYNDFRIFT